MENNNCRELHLYVATTSEEISEGLSFVDNKYRSVFSMSPAPPDHLILARIEDEIVGTIGLNTFEGGSLRLPKIYKFNWEDLPLKASLPRSVEFCRWISGNRKISGLLIYEAILLSLRLNKTYVWCEHSLSVNRSARMFGIRFYPVSEAEIISEEIELIYANYYKQVEAGLYLFDLRQAKSGLESYLGK